MALSPAQKRASNRAQRALAKQQRAIREGRAKPKLYEPYRLATARKRGMHVIARDGYSVDPGVISKEMTKAERTRNARHANAVRKFLNFAKDPGYMNTPEGQREYNRLVRKIESYEGKQSGGNNSREYASDPQSLIQAYLADPEAFQFEDIYEDAA